MHVCGGCGIAWRFERVVCRWSWTFQQRPSNTTSRTISVHPSTRPPVHPSTRPSVHPSMKTMTSLSRSLPIPRCTSCLRRALHEPRTAANPLAQQPVRGKKNQARPSSALRVRLLQDVPRYGRQGISPPSFPSSVSSSNSFHQQAPSSLCPPAACATTGIQTAWPST